MKRFLQIILLFSIPIWVASCENHREVAPFKGVSYSPKSASIDRKSQQTSFKVVASADWTLASKADWIHPDITSGSAGTTVTVRLTVDANEADGSRRGSVEITADGVNDPYKFTVTQGGSVVLTGVNEWIFNKFMESYYWSDAARRADIPSNSLPYDQFLETLVLNAYAQGARDITENPYTIDGMYDYNGGKYTRRDNVCYSNITRTGGGRTRAGNMETLFGFNIASVSGVWPNDPDRLALLVLWVLPDSPADKAGIKRGTWIYTYNGKNIFNADAKVFFDQLHNFTGGTTMSFTDKGSKSYRITATPTDNNPILDWKIITTTPGNKKVAYLVYNGFEPGAGREYDRQLRDIFVQFKKQGATDLVLDLRYNGGGSVESSRLLSSLAGDVNTTSIFTKLHRNPEFDGDNPEVMMFLDEPGSLKLSNIYVLATGSTASASELVINSLRGVLGNTSDHKMNPAVTIIGERTNGKNVGMDGFAGTIDGSSYEMLPITFKSTNAVDFCDYAGGFMPNYNINEFYGVLRKGEELLQFGDPHERLLNAALTLIDGGTITPDPVTRAGVYGAMTVEKSQDMRQTGMRRY